MEAAIMVPGAVPVAVFGVVAMVPLAMELLARGAVLRAAADPEPDPEPVVRTPEEQAEIDAAIQRIREGLR